MTITPRTAPRMIPQYSIGPSFFSFVVIGVMPLVASFLHDVIFVGEIVVVVAGVGEVVGVGVTDMEVEDPMIVVRPECMLGLMM